MLTYDEFTARIAVRGGTLPSTSASALHGKSFDEPEELDPWHIKDPDPADWDPSRPLLLANLWETYDVYVNLARTGLWFDLNPFWHPTASCYYLRCEPEKKPTPRRRGGTLTPREPKRRTVTIPVAADIATVSAGRMRELCALGEEWRVDLEGAEGADTAVRGDGASTSIDGDGEGKATRQQRDKAGERGGVKDEDDAPSGRWRGSDDLDPVPVSVAMIDSDGTMVVIQLQHGLVEPEVDEKKRERRRRPTPKRWMTTTKPARSSVPRSTTPRLGTRRDPGLPATRSRATPRTSSMSRRSITTPTTSNKTDSRSRTTLPKGKKTNNGSTTEVY